MMLADLTPTAVQLAAFLASAMFLIGLANGILKLIDRFKDKPAPSDVRSEAHQAFVPKQDLKEHLEWDREEHDKLFRKIGGVERGQIERMDLKFAEMQQSAEEGREKIHERINDVLKAVSRMEGKMERSH